MLTNIDRYERIRPLIIWLGLALLGWISAWLLSASPSSPQFVQTIIFWTVLMLVWGGVAIALGKRGIYLKYTYLFSNMLGFGWVLSIFFVLLVLIPGNFDHLKLAAKNISDLQLIAIHILRLLAIGTIIKYLHGELPRHFLILGSLPDFLFALSAVGVTIMALNGALSPGFLIVWHLLGALAFLGAGLSMFFSMPSLIRMTHQKPDARIVFQYPMILAPNFTVPLFIIAHAIALVKLLAN